MNQLHKMVTGVFGAVASVLMVIGAMAGAGMAMALDLPEDGALLADQVVFDRSSSTLYLAAPDGLTARRLGDGERLWLNPDGGRPLGLSGDALVVLAGSGDQVHYLDPDDGRLLDAIELDWPEGVQGLIEDRPNQQFRARLYADGSGDVLVWSYQRRELRGAPAVAGINRDLNRPAISADQPGAATAAQSDSGDAAIVVSLQGALSLSRGRARATPLADEVLEQLPAAVAVELSEAQVPGEGRQFLSTDQRHVLVSAMVEDVDAWLRHRWTVFEAGAGARLGAVDQFFAYGPFVVAEERLAVIVPPHGLLDDDQQWQEHGQGLEVRRLDTGQLVWRNELREIIYRGILPP